jgi:hypothetical protein
MNRTRAVRAYMLGEFPLFPPTKGTALSSLSHEWDGTSRTSLFNIQHAKAASVVPHNARRFCMLKESYLLHLMLLRLAEKYPYIRHRYVM